MSSIIISDRRAYAQVVIPITIPEADRPLVTENVNGKRETFALASGTIYVDEASVRLSHGRGFKILADGKPSTSERHVYGAVFSDLPADMQADVHRAAKRYASTLSDAVALLH